MKKTIGIAADHAGFELKQVLKAQLEKEGYTVSDFGTFSPESMDYPDVAHPLAKAIENGTLTCGIALCGSGNGIAITLNKHAGIRAAICWNEELASLARRHNNSNICVFPARFIEPSVALNCMAVFLNTAFEGGRHQRRIDKIPC